MAADATGAERQRRHRARARAGRVVIPVEADDVALAEALIAAGFLSPGRADDREALAEATARVLDVWSEMVTRNVLT